MESKKGFGSFRSSYIFMRGIIYFCFYFKCMRIEDKNFGAKCIFLWKKREVYL